MNKNLKFKISSIYTDINGEWKRKELGEVHSVKKTKEDNHKLYFYRFQIGDFIDLNICSDN